jgi:drug/metabolite transporter (DMT)-like permease
VFAASLSAFLFAISGVCGHRSSRLIGGTEANFWRLVVALVCLGAWAIPFGVGFGGVALPVFVLSGLAGIGLGDTVYFQALPRLGSRLSLLLLECLSAPMGALIEWLWLGTTLTSRQMLAGLTILAGVAVALSPGRHLKLTRRELTVGVLLCAVAAFGGALGAVLSRKAYAVAHAAGESIDGANATFQRVAGGLIVAGICLLLVKRREFRIQGRAPHHLVVEAARHKWRASWPWIVGNSLAGQTLGVSAMQWALETTPAGLVFAVIAVAPIIVIPLSMVFEGERPTLRSVFGGVVAVFGVILLTVWH